MYKIFYSIFLFFFSAYGEIENLQTFLDQYKRPITTLKLTDYENWAALKFPERTVHVSFVKQDMKSGKNYICFSSEASTEKLTKLGDCEYFDLILVSASQLTNDVFPIICNLGDFVCVCCNNYMEKENIQILCRSYDKNNFSCNNSQMSLVIIESQRSPFLHRRNICWIHPSNKTYEVISTFQVKRLIKKDVETGRTIVSKWQAGINLLTFIYMGIGSPDKKETIAELNKLLTIPHVDWGPANMILSYNGLEFIDLIDFNSDAGAQFTPQILQLDAVRKMKKLMPMLDLQGKELEIYYWEKYHR